MNWKEFLSKWKGAIIATIIPVTIIILLSVHFTGPKYFLTFVHYFGVYSSIFILAGIVAAYLKRTDTLTKAIIEGVRVGFLGSLIFFLVFWVGGTLVNIANISAEQWLFTVFGIIFMGISNAVPFFIYGFIGAMIGYSIVNWKEFLSKWKSAIISAAIFIIPIIIIYALYFQAIELIELLVYSLIIFIPAGVLAVYMNRLNLVGKSIVEGLRTGFLGSLFLFFVFWVGIEVIAKGAWMDPMFEYNIGFVYLYGGLTSLPIIIAALIGALIGYFIVKSKRKE